jgi:hypothetical protein
VRLEDGAALLNCSSNYFVGGVAIFCRQYTHDAASLMA